HNLTGKVEPVGIDDASAFMARCGNGSLALFEATRYARGHKALYTLEINGDQPYMKHWWVPGLQIGYEHTFIHQFADFLDGVGQGKAASPTFREGLLTD